MPGINNTAQRPALGDATNRANLTAQVVADPSVALKPQKSAAAKPAPASRKRKPETSLEDEIAAYKQDLSEKYYLYDEPCELTCNQVRGKINKLIDSGIMKKVEFCKATHLSSQNLSAFLSKTGTFGGSGCTAYHSAWMWFRQRELEGLKMPDVKKRQKRDADAAAVLAAASALSSASTAKSGGASASTGASSTKPSTKPSAKPASAASIPDISSIHLEGEETDEVEVYDTCDEIRRKINAHLKTPGLTQTQFCRDLYAQLHAPKCKSIQSKQLSDFRGQKGSRTGAKSTVFYAAYVYFEKLRLAEGKPKSKHRLEMEDIWERQGGFDREHDHRTTFFVMAGSQPTVNQYGQMSCF